jgi:predicted Fe-Mo cluster-binding NifX family protein
MKICITSQGDNLDSKVEPRFGRSPYFIIYDTETSDFEAIKNPNAEAASGVGIKAGQLVADKKVAVVLTGQIGPNAVGVLKAAGIEIIDNVIGTVKEAIDKYLAGTSKSQKEPEVQAETWYNRCFRRWFGIGLGRGRGMGRGPGGRRGSAGPSGYCICPKCGEKVVHQPGVACRSLTCAKCGTMLVRE